MNEIRELIDLLNYYRKKYYTESVSEISDEEYDNLYDKLQKKENDTGIVYADSPTQSVGWQVLSKLNKVEHAVLYKSGVKLNKKDKYHIFRYYVPLAWYNGNRYQLAKRKECFVAPIKISTDETRIWSAEYLIPEECDNCMQIELETNFNRVYGRK